MNILMGKEGSKMKKILLLGDSICLGYRAYVEKMLYGWAEVIYPHENTRFSTYLLRNLPAYKKQMNIDSEEVTAVVFNSGLWDVVRVDDEMLVSKEVYADNIRRIINVLKNEYPNAMLFFATTTYPKYDSEVEPDVYRRIDDVIEYNDIAVEVIRKHGQVMLIDFDQYQRELGDKYVDSVHYDDAGYKLLARVVVNELKKHSAIENKMDLIWGKELFDEYLIKHRDVLMKKKNAIYGAGNYGDKCIKELVKKGIGCTSFIDSRPEKIGNKIEGVNVLSIQEYEKNIENKDEEMIIVAIKDFLIVGEVITMLKNRGHKCICSMAIFNYI